jgi:hypothetical protein
MRIADLLNAKHQSMVYHDSKNDLLIIAASPASGVLYVTANSPHFISGQIRLRGKDLGRYPYNYLEMIDNIFGGVKNTIGITPRPPLPQQVVPLPQQVVPLLQGAVPDLS